MKPLLVQWEGRCRAAKARGHMKARMFYTGLNRTIHLNQSPVQAALVPDDFLFTKMTSSSIIQWTSQKQKGQASQKQKNACSVDEMRSSHVVLKMNRYFSPFFFFHLFCCERLLPVSGPVPFLLLPIPLASWNWGTKVSGWNLSTRNGTPLQEHNTSSAVPDGFNVSRQDVFLVELYNTTLCTSTWWYEYRHDC